MLALIIILGFVALLFIGGAIWALKEGAPFIGFILLCLIVGIITALCFII